MARRNQHDPSDDITRNRTAAPKLKFDTDVQDAVATPEWSGDDADVELPGPDGYSFGATQGGAWGVRDSSYEVKLTNAIADDAEAGTLKESFIEIAVDEADSTPYESMSLNFEEIKSNVVAERDYQALPDLDADGAPGLAD